MGSGFPACLIGHCEQTSSCRSRGIGGFEVASRAIGIWHVIPNASGARVHCADETSDWHCEYRNTDVRSCCRPSWDDRRRCRSNCDRRRRTAAA